MFIDPSESIDAFTAVLIIACPCALALAMPFANGNVSRVLGRMGFFIRNANTLETMASATAFVFDKTGTLTSGKAKRVSYHGTPLSPQELQVIASMAASSSHPLSQAVRQSIGERRFELEVKEISGKGLISTHANQVYKIGSSSFCHAQETSESNSSVHVNIDGEHKGYFVIEKRLRSGIKDMLQSLKPFGKLHLISGDNNSDMHLMTQLFEQDSHLHFNQSPEAKLEYLQRLSNEGECTLMFGDGLNDAGALKKADIGVAVADDVYSFSPACDVIFQSQNLKNFGRILRYVKKSISIVKWSIIISLLYNVVGLSFAIRGELTPIVAAILMPLSSISVVAFVSLLTTLTAPKRT